MLLEHIYNDYSSIPIDLWRFFSVLQPDPDRCETPYLLGRPTYVGVGMDLARRRSVCSISTASEPGPAINGRHSHVKAPILSLPDQVN